MLNEAGGRIGPSASTRATSISCCVRGGHGCAVPRAGRRPSAWHSPWAGRRRGGPGTLVQPRLYQLRKEPGSITDRTFEIEFLDRGVEAYVFTFG